MCKSMIWYDLGQYSGKLPEIEHAIPCTKMNHRGNVCEHVTESATLDKAVLQLAVLTLLDDNGLEHTLAAVLVW